MKKIRVYYHTEYDSLERVCGYVMARDRGNNWIEITTKQYKRCLNNRTIGGTAGIVFHTDLNIALIDRHGYCIDILSKGPGWVNL